MCGGITVYSPLLHYGAGKTAKNVGIVGVGGLGHMGIMFAKAMGAEVTAISRSEGKKEDALKLGASRYIATGNDVKAAASAEGNKGTLDLIVCTINPPEFPELGDYLKLLKPYGHLVLVGIVAKPLVLPSFQFIWCKSVPFMYKTVSYAFLPSQLEPPLLAQLSDPLMK